MVIYAISDLHGHMPQVPPCDLLLVAGDICPDRTMKGNPWARESCAQQGEWLRSTFNPWVRGLGIPANRIIATWGNHDFYGERSATVDEYMATAPLTFRSDRSALVYSLNGLDVELSVWCSPWSNRFMDWAFMDEPSELGVLYADIPDGVDIIMSHQPPYGYGDLATNGGTSLVHVGSHGLLHAIERVKPKAVICGHIHGGFGKYEHQGVPIYNVSVVNEAYKLVNPATRIELS